MSQTGVIVKEGVLITDSGFDRFRVNVTAPASGAGPFAAGSASNINVVVTGLTTAASTASAAIVVNTTAVSATSRVTASVINYAGVYGTNGVPTVVLGPIVAATSFSFQIYNANPTNALAGAITIAFTVQN